jgi:hypothetical protein
MIKCHQRGVRLATDPKICEFCETTIKEIENDPHGSESYYYIMQILNEEGDYTGEEKIACFDCSLTLRGKS